MTKDFCRRRKGEQVLAKGFGLPLYLTHIPEFAPLAKEFEKDMMSFYGSLYRFVYLMGRAGVEDYSAVINLLPLGQKVDFFMHGDPKQALYMPAQRTRPGGHINYRTLAFQVNQGIADSDAYLSALKMDSRPDPGSREEFFNRSLRHVLVVLWKQTCNFCPMRIYLFGIPGDRHYLGEFGDRLKLISRILKDQGHEIFNAFEHGGPEEVVDKDGKIIRYKNLRDDYDALVVEISTEINPHATVGLLSDLTESIDKPVRILRPLFFEKESIDSFNGKGRELLQNVLFRDGQRFFIYYEYSSEPGRYNDQINDQLKRHLRDLCREAVSGEREVVGLIGTERMARV